MLEKKIKSATTIKASEKFTPIKYDLIAFKVSDMNYLGR